VLLIIIDVYRRPSAASEVAFGFVVSHPRLSAAEYRF
jgi:hypothetical protein